MEEFFKQILPDCEKDALEYLNSLVDRMYTNMGITPESDLSQLNAEDYPIFDDLYDEILQEFQKTDNEYIRKMLRTLMNYIAKFSTGGRNANIWNGPSTITTEENFTVFNFQSLLANRNSMIANAQMLLVLKYIDNEIIKNRDYNTKNRMSRKVIVVIDEAHVFIDEKYPIALDFMFQLAKRIRKYNGMQIVITQNIKDFVGTEEIARKSTAIINACQYSFIFTLAPNDMDDLCKLYEKAGGINEREQEQIVSAPRGQAFTVMGPSSRTTFKVEVPEDVVAMFQERDFLSRYFRGEQGNEYWEDFIGDSREKNEASISLRKKNNETPKQVSGKRSFVSYQEITEEEAASQLQEAKEKKITPVVNEIKEAEWEELPEIPDIPEDMEAFKVMLEEKKAATQVVKTETPVAESVYVSEEPSKTEKMLTEFIDKFSYDVILQEIKRTVREEVLKELAENSVTENMNYEAVTKEATEKAVETVKEVAEEKQEKNIFEDLFASEPIEDEEDDIFAALFGDDTEEEQKGKDEEFNIFAFFEEQDAMDKKISIIEKMEVFGDKVIEITLEDLALYNRNMYQRG